MAKAYPSQSSPSNSNETLGQNAPVDANNRAPEPTPKVQGTRRARSPYREPPVRPPVPSYVADGVPKTNVTSGMMPLGTMPPESLKRKVFGDTNKKKPGPLKKVNGLNGRGLAGTPDAGHTGRTTRTTSLRDERSAADSPSGNIPGSLQNSPDPVQENSSRVPQNQTVANSAPRQVSLVEISQLLPPPTMTGPLPQIHIPRVDPLPCYNKAYDTINKIIVPDRRQYLVDALKHLHSLDTGDLQFHDLLEAASAKDPRPEAIQALNWKVKYLKDRYHLTFQNQSTTGDALSTNPVASASNYQSGVAGPSFSNPFTSVSNYQSSPAGVSSSNQAPLASNHQASTVDASPVNPLASAISPRAGNLDPALVNAVASANSQQPTAFGTSDTININESSTVSADPTMPRKRKAEAIEGDNPSPRPAKVPTPAPPKGPTLKINYNPPTKLNKKKSKSGKTTKSGKNDPGESPKSPRRISSSSLSSVDENVVQKPPPPSLKPDESKPEVGDKRKRSDDVTTLPDPDPEDEEVQAKRQRMSHNLIKVDPPQSAIRSTLNRRSKVWNVPTVDVPASRLRSKTSRANSEISTPIEAEGAGKNQAPKSVGRPTKEPKKQSVRIQELSNNQKGNAQASGTAKSGPKKKQAQKQVNMPEDANEEYCAGCNLHMSDSSVLDPLLCCDGCPKSMHTSCLDPPQPSTMVDEVDEWFCDECKYRKDPASVQAPKSGLFAALCNDLPKNNPKEFGLPAELRDGYYVGSSTGPRGEYLPVPRPKISGKTGRSGYDEAPDFKKQRDAKGQLILCQKCKKSSEGNRDIVPCDYCPAHWHTDCLDTPMANPPYRTQSSRKGWMCPLHSEHDTGHIEPVSEVGIQNAGFAGRHRMRKFVNPAVKDASASRGGFYPNNGYIEIEDDMSDHEQHFTGGDEERVVPRIPASGVILDFIHKEKQNQINQTRRNNLHASEMKHERERIELINARLKRDNERRVAEDLSKRSYRERQAVSGMNLMSSKNRKDNDFDALPIEKLIFALQSEAPPEVVELLKAEKASKQAKTASGPATGPKTLTPSTTEDNAGSKPQEDSNDTAKPDSNNKKLSNEDREHLLLLKQLIEGRLAASS